MDTLKVQAILLKRAGQIVLHKDVALLCEPVEDVDAGSVLE